MPPVIPVINEKQAAFIRKGVADFPIGNLPEYMQQLLDSEPPLAIAASSNGENVTIGCTHLAYTALVEYNRNK